MTPSQESERRKVARAALRLLLNGKWHRRSKLFDKTTDQGRTTHWQKQLFKRMIIYGWIRASDGPRASRTYRATTKGIEGIDRVLDDDVLLSMLLWPQDPITPPVDIDAEKAKKLVEAGFSESIANFDNEVDPEMLELINHVEPELDDALDEEEIVPIPEDKVLEGWWKAAEALKTSSTTIRRVANELRLSLRRNEDGHYLFHPDDLDRLRAALEAKNPDPETVIGWKSAASVIGVSQSTARRLVARKQLSFQQTPEGHYLFRREELEALRDATQKIRGSDRKAEEEEEEEEKEEEEDDITPEQVQAVLLKLMGAVVEKLDRIERDGAEMLRILRQLL
jgi:excisionase family DNA binding protein